MLHDISMRREAKPVPGVHARLLEQLAIWKIHACMYARENLISKLHIKFVNFLLIMVAELDYKQ